MMNSMMKKANEMMMNGIIKRSLAREKLTAKEQEQLATCILNAGSWQEATGDNKDVSRLVAGDGSFLVQDVVAGFIALLKAKGA